MDLSEASALPSPGGYECDFVDTPIPDSLSCSVCLLPLRDPHLLDCCGIKMCALCVDRVKTADKPCPQCGERFVHILDKGTTRQVLSLKTRCSRKRKYNDCEWEGELRHLSKHETEECEWALVECRYSCGQSVARRQLAEHEQNECDQRPMDLKMETIVRKMEESHKKEMATAKEDFERILRESIKKEAQQKDAKIKQMKQTVEKKDKTYTTKFTQLKQLVEGKNKSHEVEVKQMNSDVEKLKQTVESQSDELKELRELLDKNEKSHVRKIRKMEQLVEELKTEYQGKIDLLQSTLNVHLSIPPCDLVMTDYHKHKKLKDRWYSSPFYSQPGGYKLYLLVHSDGERDGASTHMSVYVCVMKGEHDDKLLWPFRGVVTLQLLNQKSDHLHHEISVNFGMHPVQRVTTEERNGETGFGYSKIISHTLLESTSSDRQFIDSDCLKFRIFKVV